MPGPDLALVLREVAAYGMSSDRRYDPFEWAGLV